MRDELNRSLNDSLKEKKKKSVSVELFPAEEPQSAAEKHSLDDLEELSQEEVQFFKNI